MMDVLRAKKWSTLVGSCLLHFVLGSGNTMANLNTYIISYLRHNGAKEVNFGSCVWFNAVGVTTFTIATIVSGFMAQKIGTRFTCLIGTIAFCGSTALTASTVQHSFASVLISIGLIQNIGMGLQYTTVVVNCIKWFDPNHKGLVVGLITGVNSISSLVFIQIQTFYLNPDNMTPDDEGYFDEPLLLSRVPKLFIVLSLIYGGIGLLGVCALFDYKTSPEDSTQLVINNNSQGNDDQSVVASIDTLDEDSLRDILRGPDPPYYTISRAMTNKFFLTMWLTFALSTQSNYFIAAMIKAFGSTFIKDDHFLAAVLSIAFIINSVGAVFWGKVLDVLEFRDTIITINGVLSVATFSIIISSYYYKKLLFSIWLFVLYFTGIGIWSTYLPEVVRKFGDRNATVIYGLIHTGPAIMAILMSPVLQFLLDAIGWFVTFCTVGALNTTSMVFLMFYYAYRRRGNVTDDQMHNNSNHDNVNEHANV